MEWEVLRQASAGNTVLNERVDRFQINGGSWLEIPLVTLPPASCYPDNAAGVAIVE